MSWMNDPDVERLVEQNRPFPSRQPPRPRSSGSGSRSGGGSGGGGLLGRITKALDTTTRTVSDAARAPIERGRDHVRYVSRLGVDPMSPQGQEILVLLSQGFPQGDPQIMDLVTDYQDGLIGPLSGRRDKKGPGATGLTYNQYGYRAGEEFTQLDGLSTEALASVQDRMAALGMLDGYVPGRKDPKTVSAFRDLLWMSNAEGMSWMETLGDLERQKEAAGDDWAWDDGSGSGGRDRAEFVAPTYLAPDYATLAQTVKEQIRRQLGRDPDESEMALLTAELSGWDREAFDAEAEAMRAEWEAAEDGRDASPTVQTVDPAARFKESFESKFRAELSGIDRTKEATEAGDAARGAVSVISQMAGGMG